MINIQYMYINEVSGIIVVMKLLLDSEPEALVANPLQVLGEMLHCRATVQEVNAAPEFLTVGAMATAFLTGSVKGGG